MKERAPILDMVYIMDGASTSNVDELESSKYYNYKYVTQSNWVEYSTIEQPIYRYGKRLTKFNMDFNLFTYTLDIDKKSVESTFEKIKKNLKREDVLKAKETFFALDEFHVGE